MMIGIKMANQTRSVLITAFGKTQNIFSWSKEVGISASTLYSRFIRNWPIEEMLTKPARIAKMWEAFGEEKPIAEWCKQFNISSFFVWQRMTQFGMSFEDALSREIYQNQTYKALGKDKTLADWSYSSGIEYCTLQYRLRRGMSMEEALEFKCKTNQGSNSKFNRMIEFRGITKPAVDWGHEFGLNAKIIRSRIDVLGWSVEKSLTTPVTRPSAKRPRKN